MRVGQSNISRFFLLSTDWNNGERFQIEDIPDYETTFADVHELSEQGSYYKTSKNGEIQLGRKAYEYLNGIFTVHGVRPNVRLISEAKSETRLSEDWMQFSNVGVDLATMVFDDDTRHVTIETTTGGFIDEVEARWDDEFDITKDEVDGGQGLDFVQVRLEPRSILRRSRFVSTTTEVSIRDDQGSTARALPITTGSPGFTSQMGIVGSVSNIFANSVNDNYARLNQVATFLTNAPQDFEYVINGTVEIEVNVISNVFGTSGFLNLDLVRYNNGEDLDFDEVIDNLASTDFSEGQTFTIRYDFDNYILNVREGDSIGLMTLSNINTTSANPHYVVTDNTDFTITTRSNFRQTFTRAIRFKDAFKKLVDLGVQRDNIQINTDNLDLVDTGEVLLAHGTWLRNMPFVVNEGEEDERRMQSNLSMKDLFEGYSIIRPLAYRPEVINTQPNLFFGLEQDTELNFTGLSLDVPVEVTRTVIGDNFYGSLNIGSTTSGDNTEEVNNLYSMCGNANWNTFNTRQEEKYEVLTDFRTSAEDIEILRQFQYEETPDEDHDDQDSWYLIHARPTHIVNENGRNVEYFDVIKWQDLYAERPLNIFDVDSAYNFAFTPRNLLQGHGYKIKSALNNSQNDFLIFSGSNCDSSPIIDGNPEDGNIAHASLQRNRVQLVMVEFNYAIRQDIIEQLNGKTNGIDNRFGLVRYRSEGEYRYGRLIECDTNFNGSFKLIEAVR